MRFSRFFAAIVFRLVYKGRDTPSVLSRNHDLGHVEDTHDWR